MGFDQLLIKHIFVQSQADLFPTYYNKPEVRLDLPGYSNHTNYARLNQTQHQCDNVITLPEVNTLGAEMFGGSDFWLETRIIIKISTNS